LAIAPGRGEGAGVERSEAGEQVEQRRLAGSVRADQPEDLPARDREAHLRERLDPAEALADVPRLEEHAHCTSREASSRFLTAEGHRPPGRRAMTSTR